MTDERDFDRLARAWLELGPDEAPDRVVAAVLHATETTPQARRPSRPLIWRSFAMNRVAPAVGTVAVLAILVIGGALLLSQRNQPTIGDPATSPSVVPSPSLEVSASASAAPIVLQRGPDNIGCDAIDPGYRSATIRIDPESDVYLDINSPAGDGTTDRVNVDVWAEVEALASGSPDTEPVEPLPPGTRLAVYWPADFTATDGDMPVIRGPRGEEVARDGTRIDEGFSERSGYFTCASRDALYILIPTPTASTVTVDTVAVTLVDGLRVRSKPRISDDSFKYEPVLPLGTQLYVLDGPVSVSGYTWYEVASLASRAHPRGWVASAGRDGEPWLGAGDFACPPVPSDLPSLAALPSGVGLACFPRVPITVAARLISCNCEMDGPGYTPGWFFLGSGGPMLLVAPSVTRPPDDPGEWFHLNLDPEGQHPEVLPVDKVVQVTGVFDHPAAASCTVTEPDGEPVPTQGCRLEFAVTRLFTVGP